DWFDYLEMLQFFNRDINNPKFVCPKDLHKEHQRYLEKKRNWQRKQDKKKLIADIKADQKKYLKEKKKFFGLRFEQDNIVVEFMKSVNQVFEESNILKHCAFTNGYHNKKESLLFTARVNGKVTEAVEISFRYGDLKIIQSRGYDNKSSSHNKQ